MYKIPDSPSSLNIFNARLAFKYISNHIFNNATNGIWNEKNIHDQAVLKISCITNIRPVSVKVLYAEIDINMYKIGQTIPNI